MEKKFTVNHKMKSVECRITVFNRREDAPKSEQVKGQPIKKIDVWDVNAWVETKELTDCTKRFYSEQTLLEQIQEIIDDVKLRAEDYIEDTLKTTVSDRLAELGFK